MKFGKAEKEVAEYLKVLGSPFRIQILFSIGFDEACVCHLEAMLDKRQAYISQHLMVLRDAGVLATRREGKYIYYRVADRGLFDLVKSAADILNISLDSMPEISPAAAQKNCECPKCKTNPEH